MPATILDSSRYGTQVMPSTLQIKIEQIICYVQDRIQTIRPEELS